MKTLPKLSTQAKTATKKIVGGRKLPRKTKLYLERLGDWVADNRELVMVISILFIAAFFRLWQLGSLPPGLHPDEAVSGLNAISVLEGNLQPFYGAGGGREGLMFYLQALTIAVVGNSILALRLAPAIIGILSVFVLYLAAKAWFSRRVAMIASFFFATAPWAVQISRMSMSTALMLLFVPLALWLFARALQTNHARWYVLTGLSLGLGFYAHLGLFLLPLVALPLLVFMRWSHPGKLKQLWQPILIVFLSTLVTLLPYAAFIATHSDSYFQRQIDTIFTQEESFSTNIGALNSSALKTAGMLHFQGDGDQLHNLSGEPQLNALVGVLLILGLLLCVRRRRDIRYSALMALLIVMLLPAILLATNGSPSAQYAAGAAPLIYLIAAIGLSELFVRWRGVFPLNPVAIHTAIIVIVATVGLASWYNYQRYFVAWANTPETFEVHHEELSTAATYMLENPREGTYYVIVDERQVLPLRYLAWGDVDFTRIDPEDSSTITLTPDDAIIMPRDGTDEVNITGEDLEMEHHYSKHRPSVVLFSIYTQE